MSVMPDTSLVNELLVCFLRDKFECSGPSQPDAHPSTSSSYTRRMTTPPLTLRQRQKQQTRELLLETAGALFAEKGYQATSIDDIIQAAGTSRATLYAYFDGK